MGSKARWCSPWTQLIPTLGYSWCLEMLHTWQVPWARLTVGNQGWTSVPHPPYPWQESRCSCCLRLSLLWSCKPMETGENQQSIEAKLTEQGPEQGFSWTQGLNFWPSVAHRGGHSPTHRIPCSEQRSQGAWARDNHSGRDEWTERARESENLSISKDNQKKSANVANAMKITE